MSLKTLLCVFWDASGINPAEMQDKMLDRLEDAQRHRQTDPNWIENELAAMLVAVNQERHNLSKAPISLDALRRQERMAQGHSDYSRKFALYCANLVFQS